MTKTSTATLETFETQRLLSSPDVLLNLIVILLAPIFLGVTAGDVGLARLAALQTVNDYRARDHADLIAVAQIIVFGLGALGSLCQSLADEVSLSMTLRLRGNAISCNRAAEQNRRARLKSQTGEPRPQLLPEPEITTDDPPPQPEAILSAGAEQLLAAESQARLDEAECPLAAPAPTPAHTRTPEEKRHQQMWGIALAKEASEIDKILLRLPPAERRAATRRAGLLGSTAHDLIHGAPVPPIKPGDLTALISPGTTAKQPPLPPRKT